MTIVLKQRAGLFERVATLGFPLVLTEEETSIGEDSNHELWCLLWLYVQEGLWREEAELFNKLLKQLPPTEQHQIVENIWNESDSIAHEWTLTVYGAQLDVSKFRPGPDLK